MCRLVLLFALAACGDNLPPLPADDDPDHDAAPEPPDAGGALAPCIDRPTDLARPPTGQLPCDLLPPGFGS
jgi:hypothetical protein